MNILSVSGTRADWGLLRPVLSSLRSQAQVKVSLAITKLSALHFVTNKEARNRVIQMVEDPKSVFLTGSPEIDSFLQTPKLSRQELLDQVGLPADVKHLFVATFHPATLTNDGSEQCIAMLQALARFPDIYTIITGSNADRGARQIDQLTKRWVKGNSKAVFHQSLGSQRYFSALSIADVVIGNSSSGLYEAPSFGVPTVNIGDRQSRRPRAKSVIDCEPGENNITEAIRHALTLGRQLQIENPNGDGHASDQIAAIIADIEEPTALIRKTFRDINK